MCDSFIIETSTLEKKFIFISEEKGSQLIACSLSSTSLIQLTTENKKKEKEVSEVNLSEFIDVKGWKAVGNRLSFETVKKVQLVSPMDGVPEKIEQPIIEDSEEEITEEESIEANSKDQLPEPPEAFAIPQT